MSNERELTRVTYLLQRAGICKEIPDTPQLRHAARRGTRVHSLSEIFDRHFDSQGLSLMGLELRGREAYSLTNDEHAGAINRIDRGFDTTLIPYLRALQQFRVEFPIRYTRIEERIDDVGLGLSGCPDRVGVQPDGTVTLVDYKTGNEYPWHRYQLALYAVLLDRIDIKVTQRVDAYLQKDGSSFFTVHDSAVDIAEAWAIINKYLLNN
jgi:ATP-dependent exoDNAse (exonuclease V) beta subunit